MKNFEFKTNFEAGEEVYFLKDNKLINGYIEDIQFTVTKKKELVELKGYLPVGKEIREISFSVKGLYPYCSEFKATEEDIFKTEREALDKLVKINKKRIEELKENELRGLRELEKEGLV